MKDKTNVGLSVQCFMETCHVQCSKNNIIIKQFKFKKADKLPSKADVVARRFQIAPLPSRVWMNARQIYRVLCIANQYPQSIVRSRECCREKWTLFSTFVFRRWSGKQLRPDIDPLWCSVRVVDGMPRAGSHYNLGTSRGPDKIGSRAGSCSWLSYSMERTLTKWVVCHKKITELHTRYETANILL